jgi:GNAT superfamily N-acetyltransferase
MTGHRLTAMSDYPLSPIDAVDAERAYSTITAAFTEDPVERWLFPDAQEYRIWFPDFVAAVADRAFATSTAWQSEDFAAVSLCLPPGTGTDAERIGGLLAEHVSTDKHEDMFATLARMEKTHPRYPHWYLPWLGVLPGRQGNGVGGDLLDAVLEYIDRSGLPVYLESPNPRNIPFYERHGFAVTGSAEVGSCPPLACMLRDGRRS